MFGIRLQFAPQLANYDPHIFDFAFRAPLPDRMGEILMSPGLVGMRQQILQYQKLLRRQVADLAMRANDLARLQIDGTIRQQHRPLIGCGSRQPTQNSANARHQFGRNKHRRQIIVGARVQYIAPGEFVFVASQNDDSKIRPGADRPAQLIRPDTFDRGIED